jgi:hypothetical protein
MYKYIILIMAVKGMPTAVQLSFFSSLPTHNFRDQIYKTIIVFLLCDQNIIQKNNVYSNVMREYLDLKEGK